MTDKRRIAAILNCDGGTLRAMDADVLARQIKRNWGEAGHEVTVSIVSSSDLIRTLEDAGEDDSNDTIVVAGGDGTVSAGAGIAWKCGKAFGVLPAGTMNLFSRSLGSPLDLDKAIEAIAHGHLEACDIATANDRPFVHMFGVGLHPRAMKLRDKLDYDSRYGKIIASARALFKVVKRPIPFNVTIKQDGETRQHRLSALSVSNNRLSEGHLPYADRVNEGLLGLYSSEALSSWQSARLVMDIMRGAWADNETVARETASEVILEFPSKRRGAKATIDGEVIALEPRVEIRIHLGKLKVLLPPPHLIEVG